MSYVTEKQFQTLLTYEDPAIDRHPVNGATPKWNAPDSSEGSDTDMEVLYVDTNEDKRLEMKFNPVRGLHTDRHCLGLGPRDGDDRDEDDDDDNNDMEDGWRRKGWREKCYGPAFKPVPLGPPCKAVSVEGDGNCLFRAISYALCCDEAYHLGFRQKCVDELLSEGDVRYNRGTGVLPEGFETAADYMRVKRMDRSGTWGTEVEITALANLFGLPIYTYYGGTWLVYKPDVPEPILNNEWERRLAQEFYPKQGIYLVNEGSHYKPVVCVKVRGSSDCYGLCKHTYRPKGASECSYCASPEYMDQSTEGYECEQPRGGERSKTLTSTGS